MAKDMRHLTIRDLKGICVEASAIRSGWTILFWERTSPFSLSSSV
jgi:hypothetical protein